jgi:hypothetical protein
MAEDSVNVYAPLTSTETQFDASSLKSCDQFPEFKSSMKLVATVPRKAAAAPVKKSQAVPVTKAQAVPVKKAQAAPVKAKSTKTVAAPVKSKPVPSAAAKIPKKKLTPAQEYYYAQFAASDAAKAKAGPESKKKMGKSLRS